MLLETEEKKNVVVLGGGFGGVRAALDLDALLPEEYSITLIDKRSYHLPQWMLYEIAAVFLDNFDKLAYEKVRKVVAVPFSDIFKNTRVKLVQGLIQNVFLHERVVALDVGMIRFEYAVMALGSETNYFGIDGLSERSFGLKDLDEALNLRNALEELFQAKRKGERVNIVIGGGGFTGVELAGELSGLLRRLEKKYKVPRGRVRLSIVEASPCILSGAKKWLERKVLKRLTRLGIEVVTESPIDSYKDGQIFLKGGKVMPAELVIWTAGVRANGLVERLAGAPLSKSCLVADEYLRLAHHPYIYAIGDNVFCYDSAKKCPVPATAQRAIDQGHLVARNLVRNVMNEEQVKYAPSDPIFVVPVGGKYAVADLYGLRLAGFLGWSLKMLVGLKYFMSILPFYKALSLWLRGVILYVKND